MPQTADTAPSDSSPTLDSPAVLLRNEDDAAHALDVRITDDDAVLEAGCHTVAGDSQRAIGTAAATGTLRVDLRADNGGAVSLTVDRTGSVPEFVVRRRTIVVAGLN